MARKISSPSRCDRTASSRSPIAPNPGIDHGHAPVRLRVAQRFDGVAEAGHDAVGVDMRLIVEEEFLDDVRLVAEAQDEILVSVLAVIAHQVPEKIGLPPIAIMGFGIFSE